MKYTAPIGCMPARVELTRRNLMALLAKLDDPDSVRTLAKQEDLTDRDGWIFVVAVEDEEHYADRNPGAVYMPTTGEHQ